MVASTVLTIPIIFELAESKQALEETAMRVTHDAPVVRTSIWMLGDNGYDTDDW